ncbi:MAG: hypothetical protein R3C29_17700 [Dehalococcoidia bacterium]
MPAPLRGWFPFVVGALSCGPVPDSRPEAAPSAQLPVLTPSPAVSIASQEFSAEPGGLARLSDGRLAFLDWGARTLFYFDSTGAPIGQSGRPGFGPGEFQSPQLVQVMVGDTVVIWDQLTRRVSWFGPSGNLTSELVLDPRQASGAQPLIGMTSAGDLLVRHETTEPGDSAGFLRKTATLRLLGRDGRVRHDIGRYPAGWEDPKGYRFFGWTLITRLAGDRIYLGTNDRWEIVAISLRGDTIQHFRKSWEPRPVTAADREALQRTFAERHAVPGFADADRFAPTVPAFGRLLVDPKGRLWAPEYAPPYHAPTQVTVMGSTGLTLGALALPEGFRPSEVGADYMLGWRRDGDGLLTLALYRLVEKQ